MQKTSSIILAAAALAAFSLTGCETQIAVPDNHYDTTARWNEGDGTLTLRFPGKTLKEAFNASKKGIDQLYGAGHRVGEDRDEPEDPLKKDRVPPSYKIYARVTGDILVTINIYTAQSPKSHDEWTQVVVKYGTWGNTQESQKIAAFISRNL
ncbi:MAG: hypothetical protein LBV54_08555 [Puniceicoccales bacterium]|jgi:hypothetical protein|nr:hypothetical protein [Puniceicoccales bacterium]